MFNGISQIIHYYMTGGGPKYTEVYRSNWSVGVDSWTGTRVSLSGNIDGIAGQDDCLRAYATGESSTHQFQRSNIVIVGKKNRVSFKYFIPSGQTNVNGIRVLANSSTLAVYDAINAVTDQWVSVVTEDFDATSGGITILQRNGSGISFTGANSADDDIIYLKDFVVETLN